jgi:CheY-like chemotaxis protein
LKQAVAASVARILVIEDNASDVLLLERALKRHEIPYQLTHLVSGAAAINFIRREGVYSSVAIPNLILLDLNLAKYTGEEVVLEVQKAGHLAGVPLCVWSSSRSRRDETVLKDLGVSQFITKPSGLERFMEIGKTIKDLLAASPAA